MKTYNAECSIENTNGSGLKVECHDVDPAKPCGTSDPVYAYPTRRQKKRRGERYYIPGIPVMTTKNEPQMEAAILFPINGTSNRSDAAITWENLNRKKPDRVDQIIEKTDPARFRIERSEKIVQEKITSKSPSMPIILAQKKLGRDIYMSYTWQVRVDHEVFNPLLSEIREYTLRSPNGRMMFSDSILNADGIMTVAVTLGGMDEETWMANQSDEIIVYGGKIPHKEDAYVYLTFERERQVESVPTTETQTVTEVENPSSTSPSENPTNPGGTTERNEYLEERTKTMQNSVDFDRIALAIENSTDENRIYDSWKELSDVLPPRTLSGVTVIVKT